MRSIPHVLTAVTIALTAAVACTSGPSVADESSYVGGIADARVQKDKQFREFRECGQGTFDDFCSPVPMNKREALLPLRYFPVDSNYSVPAVLQLADERPVVEMPTSTGAMRRMQRVGVLSFTFGGQPLSLGAYVEDGTQQITTLFVPFADTTTGTETYSAGRYLDLHPTATRYYTIDFNRAYNPYCAYNATYECPFPPASNRLKVPIRAGEKSPGA